MTAAAMPLRDAEWFRCFGCAPGNPRGLALTPRRTAADEVSCDITFPGDLCSYPGIVHGGIVSTAVDDLMANLILMERRVLTFSTVLRTRFLSPVLVGRSYRIVARVTGEWPGGFRTAAEVSSAAEGDPAEGDPAEGDLCATATGTYAPLHAGHVRSLVAAGAAELSWLTDHVSEPEPA